MTAPAELIRLTDALLRAAQDPAGAACVAAHDEDYELFLRDDQAGLVLSMRDGVAKIVATATPGFCSYTRATFDPDVFADLAAATITPTEAVEAGRILLQSRLYGGGQLLRLMRIAQLARALATPSA